MAVIAFYETSPVDRFQLSEALRNTDHYWTYESDTINETNINPNAEVISVFMGSKITKEIMDKMPRLRLIAVRASDYDHIDLDHAYDRNISITVVPSYGESAVAEHAFALILSLVRKLDSIFKQVKGGSFSLAASTGTDLKGKTIGIIGTGKIGSATAKIARGFGMHVLAHDPRPNTDLANHHGVHYTDFDTLLQKSDIVSLHTNLTPETFHLINKGSVERMKRGVILINTARGGLVENRALIDGLRSGHISAAGLDTFEGEDFVHTESIMQNLIQKAASPESYLHIAEVSALRQMKNVIITPHTAFNTANSIKHINEVTTKNIIDFWYGLSPNRVDKPSSSGKLVIVRHGQSEWNALGKWTGTTDVHLTPAGIKESAKIGRLCKDIIFDYAYISQQVRTKETIEAFMNGAQQLNLRMESSGALNERDYGIYTGMRKNDIKKIIGEEAYTELRRSWDGPVEGGESLKDVYERTIPFYLRIILPRLRHGQNIVVVAHGNSIRSLIKYIEDISDSEIGEMEMIQGCALVYEVDNEGRSKSKEVYKIEEPAGKTEQDGEVH